MSQHSSVNVQDFINEHPFSGFQWLIFTLCLVIVLLDGFDTAAIGFIAPSLVTEWHISKPMLAPVLSAALFGLAFGAIVAGPLSDRIGRRSLLIGSTILFGIACLASAFVADISQLTIARFITGIGLGAAMPNAVTMTSEFCPDTRRAMLTNLMFCGFPLGAACGGFLAAWMIPQFGWHSVLLLGGITPLVLAAVMLFKLPESIRYMVSKPFSGDAIRAVLRRISPDANAMPSFEMNAAPQGGSHKGGIRVVLSRRYIVGSLMLWVAYFMGLVIFYAVINWMPILLKDSGLSPRGATLISALFPLGGIGAVLSGIFMDRFSPDRVVAACYALTAVSVCLIGQVIGNVGLLIVFVLLSGVLMNTAQVSLPSLAAAFYPTEGRGTGVAWMLGIGRFGGVAGSFLVAELTREHASLAGIFATLAIGGIVAAIALMIKHWGRRGESSSQNGIRESVMH